MHLPRFLASVETFCRYSGNVKQLWAELSDEKDEATYKDLDHEGFELLQALTSLIEDAAYITH